VKICHNQLKGRPNKQYKYQDIFFNIKKCLLSSVFFLFCKKKLAKNKFWVWSYYKCISLSTRTRYTHSENFRVLRLLWQKQLQYLEVSSYLAHYNNNQRRTSQKKNISGSINNVLSDCTSFRQTQTWICNRFSFTNRRPENNDKWIRLIKLSIRLLFALTCKNCIVITDSLKSKQPLIKKNKPLNISLIHLGLSIQDIITASENLVWQSL
jgi:hypothetical protein